MFDSWDDQTTISHVRITKYFNRAYEICQQMWNLFGYIAGSYLSTRYLGRHTPGCVCIVDISLRANRLTCHTHQNQQSYLTKVQQTHTAVPREWQWWKQQAHTTAMLRLLWSCELVLAEQENLSNAKVCLLLPHVSPIVNASSKFPFFKYKQSVKPSDIAAKIWGYRSLPTCKWAQHTPR